MVGFSKYGGWGKGVVRGVCTRGYTEYSSVSALTGDLLTLVAASIPTNSPEHEYLLHFRAVNMTKMHIPTGNRLGPIKDPAFNLYIFYAFIVLKLF